MDATLTRLVDEGKRRTFTGLDAWDAIMDPSAKKIIDPMFEEMPTGDPILPTACVTGADLSAGSYQVSLVEENGPYPNQRRVIMGHEALLKYQLRNVTRKTPTSVYEAIREAPPSGFIWAEPRQP